MAFMNNSKHPLFSNNGGHRTAAQARTLNTECHSQPAGSDRHRDAPHVIHCVHRGDTLTFLVDPIESLYFCICPRSQNINQTGLFSSGTLGMNGF